MRPKTKDDAKALDLEKTRRGAGDVKEDVKRLKHNAKGMMTNPMGSRPGIRSQTPVVG